MSLSRISLPLALVAQLLISGSVRAQPIDAAAARELLKQGYMLKKEGKYEEALARLVESLRLDSQLRL